MGSISRAVTVAAAILTLAGQPVWAQQGTITDEEPIALAPVTVYGERVRRGLQDVVGSVAVIDATAILDAGIDNLNDAFRLMPNVSDADWVDAGILIRGINSEGVAGPTSSPLATVYVDGVAQTLYSSRRGALGAWDVEQMEVWRGPQSTLSGRNALAGKVEIRTKDPTMVWEGAVQGEVGNRSRNQQALAISGPLVEDRLAFRVAAERRAEDGHIDYPLYEDFPRIEERAEDQYHQIRGKLLFTPNGASGLRALLSVNTSHDSPSYDDADGPLADGTQVGLDSVEYEDRIWGLQVVPVFVEARSNDNQQAALELAWAATEELTLHSTTTWLRTETLRPSVDLAQRGVFDETEWSQEVRAEVVGDAIEAVAGAYLLTGDGDSSRDQKRPWEDVRRIDASESSFTNVAAFGEVRWNVTSALTLIAGARYDQEEQEFSNSNRRVDAETGEEVSAGSNESDASFGAFLPKVGVSYETSGGGTLGATVQRAYRAGGAAIDFVTGEPYEYDPEHAWNFELSWRGRIRDRVRYAFNAFYLDWRDQQLNVPQVPGDFTSDVVVNAGESTVRGVEAEIAAMVTPALDVFGSLGVAKTEFEDFSFPLGESLLDLGGEPFPQSPEVTGVAGFDLELPAGFFLSGDAGYTGSALSRSYLEGVARDELPAYTLLNLRAGWESDGLEVTGYVENVTDEEYFRYRSESEFGTYGTLGEPRSVGVVVTVHLAEWF